MVDRRSRFAVDDVLVGRLAPQVGDVVVELGCGAAHTLEAAVEAVPGLSAVGLDLDGEALAGARRRLGAGAGRTVLAVADLSRPLPLAGASVDRLLCHNVLEQLPDPAALLAEAARVLRPGATSVWSHTDFDSAVFSGGDVALTRRVVHAYADTPDPGSPAADGQMGRKLAALVAHSPLERGSVDTLVLVRTERAGLADLRLRSTYAVVREAVAAGTTDLTLEELDAWRAGLEAADAAGRFLYAHTTFVVTAVAP